MMSFTLPLLLCTVAASPQQPDIVVADFESVDYGFWHTTGTAFGSGPARGTLPLQMEVSGFLGQGLVNSYCGGDGATGTLTSPLFTVKRRYMTFLIGGGGYENTTCVNLIYKDQVVRTATGPNTVSGGSEALGPWAWDLQDLQDEAVSLQVVDARTGGWGHINLDHVVQTDVKPVIPPRPTKMEREVMLDKRYLLFPVKNGARKNRIDLHIDGVDVRQFDIELASNPEEISFWSHLDVASFSGKPATLRFSAATPQSVDLIQIADAIPTPDDLYDEALRPQLRFSQRIGWNNDPNGMVYANGEWHLYYQHNPYGWNWGNMHWGHAVSRDLVHWRELPIAIYNHKHGDWAFSGGAVVDVKNTAGWQVGDRPAIVASWTSTGRGECLAYSNDGGRSFIEYEGNPVVQHTGRDPKIIWYAPGQHWVMAVYSEVNGQQTLAIYTSTDLKKWHHASNLPGYYECPEIFELAVDGDSEKPRWVVFAADAQYAIGDFDGKKFTPGHEGKHRLHYGNYYASQTFSNAPDGRRIQIGWARINFPDMAFNQGFSLPHQLTLRTTADGIRMFAEPVEELNQLRNHSHGASHQQLQPGKPYSIAVDGELFDVRAKFRMNDAKKVGLDIGDNRISYDAVAQKLGAADLNPVDGVIEIRVIMDRPMLEIIGNQGRVYLTQPRNKRGQVKQISAFADGAGAELIQLEIHRLKSIWNHG
ncbi:MAG: glycoside hydrolase family 32 protein [Planctomycetes bacterium]|nr:glycoside hydrolase family 32 protein [Planctomycetota bacterium]